MPTLLANTIQEIFCFALDPNGSSSGWGDSCPAFRVIFSDSSLLVLKAEINSRAKASSPMSAKFGASLMRMVDRNIQNETCKPPDLMALKTLLTSTMLRIENPSCPQRPAVASGSEPL